MPQKKSLKVSNIDASVNNLEGKANEDRFQLYSDELSSNNNNYLKVPTQFGFGVFDGHGGQFGSDVCANRFCQDIWKDFNLQKSFVATADSIDSSTCVDALLCSSIRKVCKELNRHIKKESRTGATVISLFMRKTDNGETHVYCANIGDSRCIAQIKNTIFPLSNDHNIKSELEFKRIDKHIPAPWFPLPIVYSITTKPSKIKKMLATVEEISTATTFLDKVLMDSNNSSSLVPSLTSSVSLKGADLVQLRNVALSNLVIDDDSIDSTGIPKIAEIGMTSRNSDMEITVHGENPVSSFGTVPAVLPPRRSLEGDEIAFSGQEASKPKLTSAGSSDELDATAHGGHTPTDLTSQSSLPVIVFKESVLTADEAYYDTKLDEDAEFITMPIIHQKSFIGKRVNEDKSVVGPLALFSRHGVSITMTRSLGDRHAARTCVCTPDITKVVISDSEYARFILASDGMTDVISNELAFKLTANIIDTDIAAAVLTKKALELRKNKRIRIDDITCIVVDVNPHLNPVIGQGNGCVSGCMLM